MTETKRQWWLGMVAIARALGLSSPRQRLAGQWEPKDEGLTVSMPTCVEEHAMPVAAIYYNDWSRYPPGYPLVFGP